MNNKELQEPSTGSFSRKLDEFTGIVISKEPRKVYKKNQFRGQVNYRLKILPDSGEKYSEPQICFVYANLVRPSIIETIQQSQYIDKRYLFWAEKNPKRWTLHKWKELKNQPLISPYEKNQDHREISPI